MWSETRVIESLKQVRAAGLTQGLHSDYCEAKDAEEAGPAPIRMYLLVPGT